MFSLLHRLSPDSASVSPSCLSLSLFHVRSLLRKPSLLIHSTCGTRCCYSHAYVSLPLLGDGRGGGGATSRTVSFVCCDSNYQLYIEKYQHDNRKTFTDLRVISD